MKILRYFLPLILIVQTSISAVVKKQPAFSKPIFSDAYLPAAMQVIFHTVDQLKALKMEEMQTTTTTKAATILSTSSKPAEQPKPETITTPLVPVTIELTTLSSVEENSEKPSAIPSTIIEEETIDIHSELVVEPVEENEETPELNYATPEIDHESPESVHATQETNHEIPEENQEELVTSSAILETSTTSELLSSSTKQQEIDSEYSTTAATIFEEPKKNLTIEGIVGEIYEIVKPTSTIVLDASDETIESKSTLGLSEEKLESSEDEDDETRFTLLGEKVAQVPRPSLISYLRRAKVPVSASLEQLAMLYDALSKDARKQGFGKYAGYSDEVLQTLQKSAEGGVVPQMKILLGKVLEREELSREDAKVRSKATIRDLDDPASVLNKDLRRLLPLRYALSESTKD